MRPLFSPWWNSATRVGGICLLLAMVGGPSLLMAWARTPLTTGLGDPVKQPIDFDHRHHVLDDGINCRYCHYDVERSANAGMPETALCMNCHAQIWTDSPLLEPVRESYFRNEPIHWQRVYRLPDFVFFNHAAHVRQGVGCESCHGRVDQMENVYLVNTLQMKWCLDCHREPWKHLRPPEAVTVMGYTPRERQETFGKRLQRERHIEPPTYCSGCHR